MATKVFVQQHPAGLVVSSRRTIGASPKRSSVRSRRNRKGGRAHGNDPDAQMPNSQAPGAPSTLRSLDRPAHRPPDRGSGVSVRPPPGSRSRGGAGTRNPLLSILRATQLLSREATYLARSRAAGVRRLCFLPRCTRVRMVRSAGLCARAQVWGALRVAGDLSVARPHQRTP